MNKNSDKEQFDEDINGSIEEEVLDQMVLYLNRARSENLGFNDVCSSLQKFNNLAARQQRVVEERDAARNGMFSLTDLRTDSEARINKFLKSGIIAIEMLLSLR